MRKLLCAIALSFLALSMTAQTTTSKTLVLVGEYTINGQVYVNNCTVPQVRDTMFTHPDNFSVADAFAESSYGKYNLIGDVQGPYRINANDLAANGATLNCGAYSVVSNRMKAMAQQQGVPVSSYDRFVYVLPFQAGCSAASGQAISLLGQTNVAGREHWVFDCQNAMTYEHEIGHTFVGHSNDDFDPMHNWNSTLRAFNAVAALYLNWIDPAAVDNVNGNGRYYIAPLELTRAQTSLKQIYLLTTPQNTYALSYRQPYGVDRNLGTWAGMSRLRINKAVGGDREFVGSAKVGQTFVLDGVNITPVGASPANLVFDIGGTPGPTNPNNPPQPSCAPNATTLCLRGGRFSVTATWKTGSSTGPAQSIPFSNDTGYFWFFGANNVELAVKVLDGTPVNNRFWVFYGGLTDLEYTITVKDLWNNVTETYTNIAGSVCGGADTSFGLPGASTSGTPPAVTSGQGAANQTCTADADTLCLQPGGDTIKVESTYQGSSIAQGGLLPNTPQGGYFTFGSASNVEQLVKVLDGRSINQRYWVFTGALSDQPYTVTFTNIRTGRWVKMTNPQGNYCGSANTGLLY